MKPAKLHLFRWAAAVGVMACIAGCSSTPISFEGPQGTVIFVNDQPHHLPTQVEFHRYAGNGQANRYNVRLVFSTPTGDMRAKGHIDVYGYTESDVDRMVVNKCTFSSEQLANLAGGKILVYKAVTASKQPLFDLTLTKE